MGPADSASPVHCRLLAPDEPHKYEPGGAWCMGDHEPGPCKHRDGCDDRRLIVALPDGVQFDMGARATCRTPPKDGTRRCWTGPGPSPRPRCRREAGHRATFGLAGMLKTGIA